MISYQNGDPCWPTDVPRGLNMTFVCAPEPVGTISMTADSSGCNCGLCKCACERLRAVAAHMHPRARM
jgi:hypothetical protein